MLYGDDTSIAGVCCMVMTPLWCMLYGDDTSIAGAVQDGTSIAVA